MSGDAGTGFAVRFYDELASTSDTAKALAAAGAPHGTAIAARRQTAGRGRLGRRWESPPGNLYVSFVLRHDVALARRGELGFAAALAAAETVESFLPAPSRPAARPAVRLKWPNDVLLEHGASAAAKIAGILLEAAALDLPPGGMPSAMTPSGVAPWVVLGIGINLRQAPSGLTYAATSLADVLAPLGLAPPPPEAAYARLATALGAWLALWEKEGFAPLRAAWLRRGPVPGTPLAVAYGDSTRRGTFHDLAPDGALVLATAEGLWQARAGVVT